MSMTVVLNQKWRYTCSQYVVEAIIIRADNDGNVKLEVTKIISGSPAFNIGHIWPTSADGIKNNPEYSLVQESKESLGVICSKCKEIFPYAEASCNFECWACRSGW